MNPIEENLSPKQAVINTTIQDNVTQLSTHRNCQTTEHYSPSNQQWNWLEHSASLNQGDAQTNCQNDSIDSSLQIVAQAESILYKLQQFSRRITQENPNSAELIKNAERLLFSLSVEIRKGVKLQTIGKQQLEISNNALKQREAIIQEMRKEIFRMQQEVQQSKKELDAARLRYERYTKLNNENFYKISEQIKDRINIKAGKQQQEINRLQNLISSPGKGAMSSPHKSLHPISVRNKSKANYFIFSQYQQITRLKEEDDQIVALEMTEQSHQIPSLKLMVSRDEENSKLEEKKQNLLGINGLGSNRQINSQFELPSQGQLEELKRFFIHTDLSDLKCSLNKKQLNVSNKVQQQKAKLQSMFQFKQATFTSCKQIQLEKKQSITSIKDIQLKTAQQQFNQTLNINYHHTKASPLAQKFFQFKEDKNNNYKNPINSNSNNNNSSNPETIQSSIINNNSSLRVNGNDKTKAPPVQIINPNENPSTILRKNTFVSHKSSQSQFLLPMQTSSYASPPKTQSVDIGTKQRNEFLQHSSDFQYFTLLLDMSKSEKSLQKLHKENVFINFASKVFENELSFRTFLMNLSAEKYSNLFESIKYLIQSELSSLHMILKLKKIIQSVSKMHQSLMLSDAFNTIINETCQILNCDRSSVFLIDPRRNQLWTKVAKNSKPIRVNIGKGLVGQVAQTGEILNILDAHQDNRFNKEIDIKNDYRTKSVLCVPIKDQNSQNPIGIISKIIQRVLQAINKNEGEFFTKEDEGLMQIMAQLATAVLRNSLYHDEREIFHNSMKLLLESGKALSQEQTLPELIVRAQLILSEKFDVQAANLWINDEKNKQLVRYFQLEEQNEQIQEQRIEYNKGIVGDVYERSESQNVQNAYQHPLYNGIIDLNTQMPIITVIIKSRIDSLDNHIFKKVGILQCINPKGLESLVFNHNHNNSNSHFHNNTHHQLAIPHAFYEILTHFTNVLGDSLIKFMADES